MVPGSHGNYAGCEIQAEEREKWVAAVNNRKDKCSRSELECLSLDEGSSREGRT